MKDPNSPYLDFAERFNQACAQMGTAGKPPSQGKLAKLFDVSRPMISNYSAGKKLPSMKTACLISEKAAVPLDWLMLGRGHLNQESSSLKALWEAAPVEERAALLASLAAKSSA